MGFLAGKRLLITGVLSNRSIAYGIARACHARGRRTGLQLRGRALQGPHHRVRRRVRLRRWCSTATSADDAQIERLFSDLSASLADSSTASSTAIGFAPREAIAGDFLDGLSREAFRIAHDISAYSFPAHGQGGAAAT